MYQPTYHLSIIHLSIYHLSIRYPFISLSYIYLTYHLSELNWMCVVSLRRWFMDYMCLGHIWKMSHKLYIYVTTMLASFPGCSFGIPSPEHSLTP